MKLKRLDIHGFKSFYHRTTVAFDDGITAVVGPNGCGKSNIVDAIKWVMGEQGARSLRGKAMDDVVFAGSERRGPMGMCEVRLTFSNDGSAEVPARWREVSELAVSRRLERGRGSDYFINKQRCRLSDVQELIAGTGVGSGGKGQRAYAIIEQGQIGRIVAAKADERRVLIEEAAGITRYRSRRRQATRKMDEVRQNLDRLDDVIGEVDTQLRTLRRQAMKAERFRAYRAEADAIGRRVVAAELRTLDTRFSTHQGHTETLAEREAEAGLVAEGMAGDERALAAEATAAAEAERTVAAHVAETAQAEAESASRLEALDREARTLRVQHAALDEDADAGRARADELEAEAGRLQIDLSEAQAALQAAQAAVEARAAQVDDARAVVLEIRAEAERLRRAEAEEVQALGRAGARRDAAHRRALELRERAADIGVERGHAADARPAALAALAAAEATLAEGTTAAEQADARAAEGAEATAQAQQELHAARGRDREVTEALATVRGRLRSLEEIEARHEDLDEGARALLAADQPGVLGPVAERVRVPAEYEQAVAAALGRGLKAILVADGAAAAEALATLRDAGAGRASLALADSTPEAASSDGRLADAIPEASPLLRALLGDVRLAADLPEAFQQARGSASVVVTRDGARIERGAFLFAGGAGADSTPLRRRRQIEALHENLRAGEAAQVAAHQAVEAAQAALAAAESTARAATQAAHGCAMARVAARSERQRAQAAVDQVEARLLRFEGQIARSNDAADEALSEAAEAAAAFEALNTARTDRAGALAEVAGQVLRAEAERDAAVQAHHEARTAAVALRGRVDSLEGTAERVRRARAELSTRTQRASHTRANLETRLAALDLEEAQLRAERVARQGEATAARGQLEAAQAATAAATRAAQAMHLRLADARDAREAARSRLTEARLELQAARLEREHLQASVSERFGVEVEALLAETADQPPPSAAERAHGQELEALLARMGAVNLGAIEAHAEVEARAEALTGQRDDLLDALGDLQTAIDRIDETSRGLFAETFAAVNAGFEAIFPRLFRGGRGALVLTDPDDLLATGIEMLVHPPGKTVQNVALLSGGEKALCALALVFAVFRVKPSPFCLLDEVDAPLDEANIGRFNEIVREMSQTSQIVLITHNKRTMEIADVLYGITMEESGISKLVGVRMN